MARDLGDSVLWTTNHATALDLALLPGGDAVVLARSGHGNAFGLDRDQRGEMMVVARISPSLARPRWVRHFLPGRDPQLFGLPTRHAGLASDGVGNVFVFGQSRCPLFAPGTGQGGWPGLSGRPGAPDVRPSVFSLDKKGNRRWAHHFIDPETNLPERARPTALLPDGHGGVFVGVNHLGGLALVHLSTTGKPLWRRELLCKPLPSPRACSSSGSKGAGLALIVRLADGDLLVSGYSGVALTAGRFQLAPRRSYWLKIGVDGTPRWLKEAVDAPRRVLSGPGPSVVALKAGRGGQRVSLVDVTSTGRNEQRTLYIGDDQRYLADLALVNGTTLLGFRQSTHGTLHYGDVAVTTSTVSPTRTAAVIARLDRKKNTLNQAVVLRTRPPGGPDGHSEGVGIVRLAGRHDGSELLVLGSFVGRLEVGEHSVTSGLRTRPCHPGRVGHERSLPPGCTRREQTGALFLLGLPVQTDLPKKTQF